MGQRTADAGQLHQGVDPARLGQVHDGRVEFADRLGRIPVRADAKRICSVAVEQLGDLVQFLGDLLVAQRRALRRLDVRSRIHRSVPPFLEVTNRRQKLSNARPP